MPTDFRVSKQLTGPTQLPAYLYNCVNLDLKLSLVKSIHHYALFCMLNLKIHAKNDINAKQGTSAKQGINAKSFLGTFTFLLVSC